MESVGDIARAAAAKSLVCVVDANSRFRADVREALTSYYEVLELWEQGPALETISTAPPAAIILDENVVPNGGLALLREIGCVPELRRVPLICTAPSERSTFLADAKGLGVRTTLVKPFRRNTLLQALSREINEKVERSWLKIEPVQQAALRQTTRVFNEIADLISEGQPLKYDTVSAACEPLIEAVLSGNFQDMLNGVRNHDNYTYVHSFRVATFLSAFGHALGIGRSDLLTLATGGLIHDVGKMSVPWEILNQPTRLSDKQMAIMRSHVTHTKEFLRNSPGIPKAAITIAEQHHEKLDGSGYPRGLKAAELNELARMATIIDIFGAMTDRRVYRDAMAPEQAFHVMTQMDKELDQHLLAIFRGLLLDTAKRLN